MTPAVRGTTGKSNLANPPVQVSDITVSHLIDFVKQHFKENKRFADCVAYTSMSGKGIDTVNSQVSWKTSPCLSRPRNSATLRTASVPSVALPADRTFFAGACQFGDLFRVIFEPDRAERHSLCRIRWIILCVR